MNPYRISKILKFLNLHKERKVQEKSSLETSLKTLMIFVPSSIDVIYTKKIGAMNKLIPTRFIINPKIKTKLISFL